MDNAWPLGAAGRCSRPAFSAPSGPVWAMPLGSRGRQQPGEGLSLGLPGSAEDQVQARLLLEVRLPRFPS